MVAMNIFLTGLISAQQEEDHSWFRKPSQQRTASEVKELGGESATTSLLIQHNP